MMGTVWLLKFFFLDLQVDRKIYMTINFTKTDNLEIT